MLAHHSANAQFDTKQDVTLIGVVTKVENINPHSWHLEVKGPDGKITKWKLESLSPNGLIRQGLKVKSDIKIGDDVPVQNCGRRKTRWRTVRSSAS